MSVSDKTKYLLTQALCSHAAADDLLHNAETLPSTAVVYHPANPYALQSRNQLVVMNVDNQVGNLPPATGSGVMLSFKAEAPATVLNIWSNGTDQIDALGVGPCNFQIWIGNPSASLVDVAPGLWVST